MGNQTFCHCVNINKKDKTFRINIDDFTQENDAFSNDLSKSHLTIVKTNNNDLKSLSTKNMIHPNIKIDLKGRRLSFQDPELSFVTIHMKSNKINQN
jgi:hypothetical protein